MFEKLPNELTATEIRKEQLRLSELIDSHESAINLMFDLVSDTEHEYNWQLRVRRYLDGQCGLFHARYDALRFAVKIGDYVNAPSFKLGKRFNHLSD